LRQRQVEDRQVDVTASVRPCYPTDAILMY
jgi:hypothetical protein